MSGSGRFRDGKDQLPAMDQANRGNPLRGSGNLHPCGSRFRRWRPLGALTGPLRTLGGGCRGGTETVRRCCCHARPWSPAPPACSASSGLLIRLRMSGTKRSEKPAMNPQTRALA